MKYSYTVLGHNNTPVDILVLMNIFADTMNKTHELKTTCSSHLECSAFNSAKKSTSYSPWKGYNNHINENEVVIDKNKAKELLSLDETKALKYNSSTDWEDRLVASMIASLYDAELSEEKKSSFIIHYDGKKDDIVSKVIDFAVTKDIEVFDLSVTENKKRIITMLKKKINIEDKVEDVITKWKTHPPIGVVSCLKEEIASKAKIVKKLQI